MERLKLPWLGTALLCAILAVGLVFVALHLPGTQAKALLVFGALVFIVVLLRNPEYRYWNAFVALGTGYLTGRALPNIAIVGKWKEATLGFELTNESSSTLDVVVGIVCIGLLMADYFGKAKGVLRELSPWLVYRQNSQIAAAGHAQQTQIESVGSHSTLNFNQGLNAEDAAKLWANTASQVISTGDVAAAHADLDLAKQNIDDGNLDMAFMLLEKIRSRSFDVLSDRHRFRLLKYIARTYELKDDLPRAASFYFQAVKWQPADEEARGLEACAHFLVYDNAKALEAAERLLIDFPNSATGWSIKVRTSEDDIDSLEQSIPTTLASDIEVLCSLCWRCRQNDEYVRAEGFARRAYESEPDNVLVQEVLATAIIAAESIIRGAEGKQRTEESDARAREVCTLVNSAIAKRQLSKQTVARLRFSRAVAYELLESHDSAETDYRIAREASPNDTQNAKFYAKFLLNRNRLDEAIEILRNTTAPPDDVDVALMLAELLVKRGQSQDRSEAISLLENKWTASTDHPEGSRLMGLVTMLVQLYGIDSQFSAALGVTQREGSARVPEPCLLALRSDVLRRANRIPEAEEAARKAFELMPPETPWNEQEIVAQCLSSLKMYKEATAVWKRILTPREVDNSIRLALHGAQTIGDTAFILEYCKSLRAAGHFDDYCIELELLTLDEYHEYAESLAIIEEALPHANDAMAGILRVRRSRVGLQTDDLTLIETDQSKLPAAESVNARIGTVVSAILRRGPTPMLGVEYAYTVLHRHFREPEAHKGFVAAIGIGDETVPECAEVPQVIAIGTAVELVDNQNSSLRWVVIEESSREPLLPDEIRPENSLARELIGKKVGEEVFLRRDSFQLQDRKATIKRVLNKFQYRKLDAIDHWEERFPDEFFVQKYTSPIKPNGEPDLDLIFRSLDRRAEQAETLHEAYRLNPISVLTFAHASGITVLEGMYHLTRETDLPIRCCRGNEEEWDAAYTRLSNARSVVLDESAIATIWLLGIHKLIDSFPFPVIVCQSVLSELKTLRQKEMLSESGGSMAKKDGKYVYVERTPQDRERFVGSIDELIAWIQSVAEVRGGLALTKIDLEQRERLVAAFGKTATECIAIAVSEGGVLWTDDFAVAEIAGAQLSMPRTWTQNIVNWLVDEAQMCEDVLVDVSVQLLQARFTFTRLHPEFVLAAALTAKFDCEKEPLRSLCNWFSVNEAVPEQLIGFAARSLVLVSQKAPLEHQSSNVTLGLLRSMGNRTDGAQVLAVLRTVVHFGFGVDVLAARRCEAVIGQVIGEIQRRGLISPGEGGTEIS